MFCEYCGKKLVEGSKFCTSCGKPVVVRHKQVQQNQIQESVTAQSGKGSRNKEKQGNRKTAYIGISLVVLIAVLVLAGRLIYIRSTRDSEKQNGHIEKEVEAVDDNSGEIEVESEKVSDNTGAEEGSEEEETEEVEKETKKSKAENSDLFNKKDDREENKNERIDDEDEDELFRGNNSDFVFPNSAKYRLTEEEIEDMLYCADDPVWELRIAINELYARHGRKFDTPEIRDYFESMDWYEGTIDGDYFDTTISPIR